MKGHLSTWAVLLVVAIPLLAEADTRVSTQPTPGANHGVLTRIRGGGHHNIPFVHARGVSALPKKGRPLRPESSWKPKKERSAKHQHLMGQHPAPKKLGKMPGEGKRWEWKNISKSWKGASAKRMPGFHLRKTKKRGKGKGKKVVKSSTPQQVAAQPASAPQAVASSPHAIAAPPSSVSPPAAQQALSKPTSTPLVFDPVKQMWMPAASAAATPPPMGWAAETLAPVMPKASTTAAPLIWAQTTTPSAFRGAPAGYPAVVASTFPPVAQYPTATFAPVIQNPAASHWAPAQYHAVAPTTTALWR